MKKEVFINERLWLVDGFTVSEEVSRPIGQHIVKGFDNLESLVREYGDLYKVTIAKKSRLINFICIDWDETTSIRARCLSDFGEALIPQLLKKGSKINHVDKSYVYLTRSVFRNTDIYVAIEIIDL